MTQNAKKKKQKGLPKNKSQRVLETLDRGQRFSYKDGYFEVTSKNDPSGIEVELISGHYKRHLPGERLSLPRRIFVFIRTAAEQKQDRNEVANLKDTINHKKRRL